MLTGALNGAGHQVRQLTTSTDALIATGHEPPDVVIMNWHLRDVDPIAFITSIVRVRRIPIIALTEQPPQTTTAIAAFQAGLASFERHSADPMLVLAQVEALIRLLDHQIRPRVTVLDSERDLVFDSTDGVVMGGRPIPLTITELALLDELVTNADLVVSREDLIERAWPEPGSFTPRLVDAHVSRIRAKIEPQRQTPKLLHTVWGRGYRLTPR